MINKLECSELYELTVEEKITLFRALVDRLIVTYSVAEHMAEVDREAIDVSYKVLSGYFLFC